MNSDRHRRGGAIFQRDWFQYDDELPSLPEIAQSWDMAFRTRKATITWSVSSLVAAAPTS
jgi:hypothetical protein